MSRSNGPLLAGVALAGGVGYYLYSAGGSPKAAEKNFEHDLRSARDRATNSGNQTRTDAQKYGAEAGAKFDSAVAKAQDEYNRASSSARDAASDAANKAENYGKDVRSHVNKSINDFDKKVEGAASKTKGDVSSWFGGK